MVKLRWERIKERVSQRALSSRLDLSRWWNRRMVENILDKLERARNARKTRYSSLVVALSPTEAEFIESFLKREKEEIKIKMFLSSRPSVPWVPNRST